MEKMKLKRACNEEENKRFKAQGGTRGSRFPRDQHEGSYFQILVDGGCRRYTIFSGIFPPSLGALPLLRGRRGTMCAAKGSDVRPGVPWGSTSFAWQAWDNVPCQGQGKKIPGAIRHRSRRALTFRPSLACPCEAAAA